MFPLFNLFLSYTLYFYYKIKVWLLGCFFFFLLKDSVEQPDLIKILLPEQEGFIFFCGWQPWCARGVAVKRGVCYTASPHFTLFVIKVVSAFPS